MIEVSEITDETEKREKKNGTKEKHINKNGNRSASCVCMLYSVGKCDSGDQDRVSADGGGAADTASQIVFAGIRFTLAGLLVLILHPSGRKKC